MKNQKKEETNSKVRKKQLEINELGGKLMPWKGDMPIEIKNTQEEIWVKTYETYSYFQYEYTFTVPVFFKGNTLEKTVNFDSVAEAVSELFVIVKETDGTSHFTYNPTMGASFITFLHQTASKIYDKTQGKNANTISIDKEQEVGDEGETVNVLDRLKTDSLEDQIFGKLKNIGNILSELENSFAGFKGKAKQYIAYRALFTYDFMKAIENSVNRSQGEANKINKENEKIGNVENDVERDYGALNDYIEMMEEYKEYFINNLDINYFSFETYRELWKEQEKGKDIPAHIQGFIEYNVTPPIDTFRSILSNDKIREHFLDNRDKALQLYMGSKTTLYTCYIKPYDSFKKLWKND